MVHHAHLVGFSVTNTDDRIVKFHSRSSASTINNRFLVAPLLGMTTAEHEVYSSFQTGFRFSRNEAIPSLKSGVQRMRAFSSTARSMSASSAADSAQTSKRLARVKLLGLAS